MIPALVLSASLSIAPSSVAAAAAVSPLAVVAPSGGDAGTNLDVKASHTKGFAEHADLVRDTLDTKAREQLANAELDPAWSVHVAIDVRKVGLYGLTIHAENDGVRLESAVFESQCEQCLMDDLVEKTRVGIDAQLAAIREADAAARAPSDTATPPGDTGTQTPEDVAAPPPDRSPAKPLRAMGKAGIGLLVVGAVGLGVGIGLAVRGEKVDQGQELDTVDLGPPGYAILAVGGAALVTGAVLLGVDRVRAKRRAQAFAPLVGPRMVGFAVAGRF